MNRKGLLEEIRKLPLEEGVNETGITAEEAAPLLCAGETTFSALHNSSARMGDLVAVSGMGGLGHLAVQYARKSGFEVAAISRGADKKELALKLGAHHYIDSEKEDPAESLKDLGGAKVILATAPNAKVISSLIGGLGTKGELIIAAVDDTPLDWSAMDFLMGPNTVKGTFTDIILNTNKTIDKKSAQNPYIRVFA